MTYWSIFSIFQTIEPFFDVAFHPWIKVAILAWLSLPRFQGSFVLYNRVLVPHLDKYEATVDGHIDDMREEAKRRAWSYMLGNGRNLIQQLFQIGKSAKDGNLFLSKDEQNEVLSDAQQHTPENIDDDETLTKQSPIHSITMSGIYEENEEYLNDFLELLSRGLFVFACTNDTKSNLNVGEFKLRILAYDEDKKAFVLSPLNEKKSQNVDLLIDNIDEIKASESAQGITIFSQNDIKTYITLPNVDDRDTLLEGFNVCLSELRSS